MRLTEGQVAKYNTYLAQLQEQEKEQEKWVNEAAAQGDLAENSEFDAARSELAKTRKRISKLEDALSDYTLIEPNKDPAVIDIGSLVRIRIKDTGISELDEGELFEIVEISDIVIPDSQVSELPTSSLVGRKLLGRRFNVNSELANTIIYADFDNITRELVILDVNGCASK